jgi:WD40 repeat protein
MDTDEFVRLYDQRVDTALQVAWSIDGKRIASGYMNGTVCLWTVETNKCDGFIQAHQNAVNSLAWSPNGNQLATGGDAIRIWDSHTGKLIATFGNKNDNSVYTPSYVHLVWPAPDQPLTSLVALDSFGNEALMVVYFWDVGTGKVLFEFYGESDPSEK